MKSGAGPGMKSDHRDMAVCKTENTFEFASDWNIFLKNKIGDASQVNSGFGWIHTHHIWCAVFFPAWCKATFTRSLALKRCSFLQRFSATSGALFTKKGKKSSFATLLRCSESPAYSFQWAGRFWEH